jgi:hypothetical protein
MPKGMAVPDVTATPALLPAADLGDFEDLDDFDFFDGIKILGIKVFHDVVPSSTSMKG